MADEWQAYWSGEGAGDALTGAAGAAALQRFWSERLSGLPGQARVLDIACGAGVVARQARAAAPDALITCADISEAAVFAALQDETIGAIGGVVCDASRPALAARSFDVVASQFGLEYGGLEAIVRGADLVAPDGVFLMAAHFSDGAIARECAQNDAVLSAVLEAGLIDRLGEALSAPSAESEARLLSGLDEVAAVIASSNAALAASQYCARLIQDCARLYSGRRRYAPADAAAWVHAQRDAVIAYSSRMQAMVGAALGAGDLERVSSQLLEIGFEPLRYEALQLVSGAEAGAWRIEAKRLQ